MPVITTEYKGDMLSETRIGKHTLVTDVPAGIGGKDRGPTPPQVFVASISSCIAAVVSNYCESAGLNAEGMTVAVSFEKTDKPTRLVNLKASIRMPNCDPGKRERAILKVAANCPVYRSILDTDTEMEIALEK